MVRPERVEGRGLAPGVRAWFDRLTTNGPCILRLAGPCIPPWRARWTHGRYFYGTAAALLLSCDLLPGQTSPQAIPTVTALPAAPALRAIYEGEGCAACHGAQAEGGPGVPALRGSGLDTAAFADAVWNGSPTMPSSATLAPAAVEALQGWLVGPVPAAGEGPAVVAETVRQASRWERRAGRDGEEADLEAIRLTRRAADLARGMAGSGVSPPAQGALESLAEAAGRLLEVSGSNPSSAALVDLLDYRLWPLALDAVLRSGQAGGVAGVVVGGDGRPLAGALVLSEAGRGFAARSTDAAGRFRLPELPALPAVSLWALHPEQGCLRERVAVPAGGTAGGLVLRLAGAHAVAGPGISDAAVRQGQDAAGSILVLDATVDPEAAPPSHVWAAAPALGTAARLRGEGGGQYAATYRPPPQPPERIEWQFWAVVPGCGGAVRNLDVGF